MTNIENIDKCIKKKDITRLLNFLSFNNSIRGKVESLKALKTNPTYACYFCDGHNYDCKNYVAKQTGGELK